MSGIVNVSNMSRKGQGEIIGGLIVVTVLLAILAPMLLGLVLGYSNTVSRAQSAALVNDLAANERVAVRGIPEGSPLAASGWFPGVEIINTGTIAVDLVTLYLIDTSTGQLYAAVDLTKARGGSGVIEAMYYSGGELPPVGEPIRLNPGETLRIKFNTTVISEEQARDLFVKVESARGVLHPNSGGMEETIVPETGVGLTGSATGSGTGGEAAEQITEFDSYLDFIKGGSVEAWRPKILVGYKLDPLAEWSEAYMDPVWISTDAPWMYYARMNQSQSLLPELELGGYADIADLGGGMADSYTGIYVVMPDTSKKTGMLVLSSDAPIGAGAELTGFLGFVAEVVEDGKDYLYILGYAADVRGEEGESIVEEPFQGYYTSLLDIEDYIDEWWSYTGATGELVLSTVGTADYDLNSTFPGSGYYTLEGDALVFQWTPYLTFKGYDYVEVSINVYIDIVVDGPEAKLDAGECSDFLASAEKIAYTPLITIALQEYDSGTGEWVTVDVFPVDTGFDIVEALTGKGLLEGSYRVGGSVEFDLERSKIYRVTMLFADPMLTFNPDGDTEGCTPEVTFIVDNVKLKYGRSAPAYTLPGDSAIYIVAPDDDFLYGFIDEDMQEEAVDYLQSMLDNLGLEYTLLEDEEDICEPFTSDVSNSIVFYVADTPPWTLCSMSGHHGPGGAAWLVDWLSRGNVLAMIASPSAMNPGFFKHMILGNVNSEVAAVFKGVKPLMNNLEASPEWLDLSGVYGLSGTSEVKAEFVLLFMYNSDSDDWRSFTIFSYLNESTVGFKAKVEASGVAIISEDFDSALVLVTPYNYPVLSDFSDDDDDDDGFDDEEEVLGRMIAEQLLGLAFAANDKING